MPTSRCDLNQQYKLQDFGNVGLYLIFRIIASYLLEEMEKANINGIPMTFFDENTRQYTFTEIALEQPTKDVFDEKFPESGLKKCVPDGHVITTLYFTCDKQKISLTLDDMFQRKREMFDLLVKRICYQSPELVQKHLILQA